MMKQSLAILLFTGFFCLHACDKDEISGVQKTSFVKYFTNFPVLSGADVTVTSEGYAILGTARTDDNTTQICLIRTDEFGNSLDSARTYALYDNNTAYCLKTLADGGFGILGSSLNPANGKRLAWFIRTNNVGDTLWTRQIRGTGNLEAKYFEVNSQENFFMTGYADEAGKGREIWWFGIDNEGRDIRNQRTFGFESDDEGTHLQVFPDGRLVLTGYITRSSLKRSLVIKTHDNTVYADIYEFDVPEIVEETGNCIRIIDDNNFIILGNRTTDNDREMFMRRIYMSPVQHYTEWDKSYSESTSDVSRSLILDNGSMFILGSIEKNGSSSSVTLTQTDDEGNQINRKQFGAGAHISGTSFKRTVDNGFIIVGTNAHPEQNNTALVLIKTDSDAGL